MSTTTKFFLYTGGFLLIVGLISIPSPFALQWLASIGALFLVIAGLSNVSHRRAERRMRRLMGMED